MSKRVIVLAGGKGSRLKPYTTVLPKPLMPIGDFSILEVIIRQLKRSKFNHITLAVNHQAELIKALLGDGSKWNVSIDYSLEEIPLSTIAPLKLISDLPEHFLVMNGDILTDFNFDEGLKKHISGKRVFTIFTSKREHLIDYGVIESDSKGILTSFREKPKQQFQVSMGIYALSREVLNFVPANKPFGFDDLMYSLLRNKVDVKIEIHEGLWLDIGRPDDYRQAIDLFEEKRDELL